MRIATRLVLAAAFVTAVGVGTAHAQAIDSMVFRTNFPFVAGDTTLPAGNYTVKSVDDDPSILELSNGKVSVLLATEGDRPSRLPANGEVKFNRYGNTYVLHEIVDPEAEGGAVVLPSHAEKRHQKAHGTPTPRTVPASKTTSR
jgi:hypothetical protein